MARVFFYGASTEYGYGDAEGGGYPERIRRDFMQEAMSGVRPTVEMLNFSVSAQTLPPIVDRLPRDVTHYRRGVSVAVFAIGSVDALIRRGEDSPRTPYGHFLECLQALGRICHEEEIWPIFVGPTPLRRSHSDGDGPVTFIRNGDSVQPSIGRQYRDAVIVHADSQQAPYLPMGRMLIARGLTLEEIVSADNVHPGVKAHAVMAEIAGAQIREVLARARIDTRHTEDVVPF